MVAQMQAVFIDNWIKATGDVLHGDDYFPGAVDAGGEARRRCSAARPTGGSESMQLMYLLAITAAERSHRPVEIAYFVPDELARRSAGRRAAARRARAHHRARPAHRLRDGAARASRGRGARCSRPAREIYEYQPTMFHCKVLVVDGLLVSVGSTNFDNRSFRLNDEANLNMFDAQFAARQLEIFDADRLQSRRISYAEWKNRPLTEKMWEFATRLFGSQV